MGQEDYRKIRGDPFSPLKLPDVPPLDAMCSLFAQLHQLGERSDWAPAVQVSLLPSDLGQKIPCKPACCIMRIIVLISFVVRTKSNQNNTIHERCLVHSENTAVYKYYLKLSMYTLIVGRCLHTEKRLQPVEVANWTESLLIIIDSTQ